MRQFRGFTKEGVEAKGGYCTVEGKHFIIPDDAELCNTTPDAKFMDGICGMVEVIPETVGQSTGLRDKNGKEIYEGDIIDIPATEPPKNGGGYVQKRSKRIVDWDITRDGAYGESIYAGFEIRTGENDETDCEVIGNIHTSPELPEAKQ